MDFKVSIEAFKLPIEAVEQGEEYSASGEGTIGYQAEWAYNNASSTSETILPGISAGCTADELSCDLTGSFTVPRRGGGTENAVRYPLCVYLYEHCFHATGKRAAMASPASSCCVGSVTIDLNRHIPEKGHSQSKQRATLYLEKCPYRFPNPIMVRLTIHCTLISGDSSADPHPRNTSPSSRQQSRQVSVSPAHHDSPLQEEHYAPEETEEEKRRKVQAGVDAARRRVATARAQKPKQQEAVSRTNSAHSTNDQQNPRSGGGNHNASRVQQPSRITPQPSARAVVGGGGAVSRKASSRASSSQDINGSFPNESLPPRHPSSVSIESRHNHTVASSQSTSQWRHVDPQPHHGGWQSPPRDSRGPNGSYDGYRSPSSNHSPPQPVLSPPVMSPPPHPPSTSQHHHAQQQQQPPNNRQDSISQDVLTTLVRSNAQLKEDNEKLKSALETHILNSLRSPSPDRHSTIPSASHDLQIKELQAKLETAETDLKKAREDADAYRKRAEDKERVAMGLERELQSRTAALEESQKDIHKWQEHYRIQEKEVAKLEAHIDDITVSVKEEAASEARSLKGKLLEAEKEARDAKRDNDRLHDTLADAQDALIKCEQKLDEESTKRQDTDLVLDRTLQETADKIERYEASLRLGQTELQRLHGYAEDVNKKCNELARVVASQNTVLGKRNDKIHELQGIISAMEVRSSAQKRDAEAKSMSYPPSLQHSSPLRHAVPLPMPTSFLEESPQQRSRSHPQSYHTAASPYSTGCWGAPHHDSSAQWSRSSLNIPKPVEKTTTEVILSPPRNHLSTGRYTGGTTPTTYANSAAARVGYNPPPPPEPRRSATPPDTGFSPSPRLPHGYEQMVFTAEDQLSPRQRSHSSRPPAHHHQQRGSASTRGPSEGMFSNDSQLIPRGNSRSGSRSMGRDPMADPDL